MPIASDTSGAKELTRMVASYVAHETGDVASTLVGAGISRKQWSAYTRGSVAMGLPVIVALSRALGMRPSELLAAAEVRHGG